MAVTVSVLIDAGNLVAGGGVQVGASFLDELGRMMHDEEAHRRWPWLPDVVVEASETVAANTTGAATALSVTIVNGRPAARLRQRPGRRDYDVSFTVFGPDYGPRRAHTRVCGFADVTSLFPEFAGVSGARARMKQALRARVSRQRFTTSDVVVVESSHVAEALRHRWGLPAQRLRVVPNVLNRVFFDDALREPVPLPREPFDAPVFAFPTRAYPHKNLTVLGAAAHVLREEHGREVRFALTLTDDEWHRLDPVTRAVSYNVGPLRVSQVPGLYYASDGVVFPSLNECFSVTPLEAMRTRRPLVASHRQFVREVAGDAAWYFEPTEPASLAQALADVMTDDDQVCASRVAKGGRVADSWPTGADRAVAYLDVIQAALRSGVTPTT